MQPAITVAFYPPYLPGPEEVRLYRRSFEKMAHVWVEQGVVLLDPRVIPGAVPTVLPGLGSLLRRPI